MISHLIHLVKKDHTAKYANYNIIICGYMFVSFTGQIHTINYNINYKSVSLSTCIKHITLIINLIHVNAGFRSIIINNTIYNVTGSKID